MNKVIYILTIGENHAKMIRVHNGNVDEFDMTEEENIDVRSLYEFSVYSEKLVKWIKDTFPRQKTEGIIYKYVVIRDSEVVYNDDKRSC